MRKGLWLLIILVTGCSSNNLAYDKLLVETKEATNFSLNYNYDLKVSLAEFDDEEYIYQIVVDNPKIDLNNIKVIVWHDQLTKDVFPSLGLFDGDYNLLVNNSDFKGINLVGYIPSRTVKKTVNFKVMIIHDDLKEFHKFEINVEWWWQMKKSNFLEGAMIATIGVILSKVIGLLYVIPFYSMIGTQGGALYSYGYSIYALVLSLSLTGIPTAISKLVSEYSSLGYFNTKERVYKIGRSLIVLISFICFMLLMIFANGIASLIIGTAKGGNTIESVAMIIRIVSIALLIVPFLSVTRGYLQGQKFITPTSISNVIEQLVRVTVIVGGSFFALRVFNLSIETAVGISVFGATAGAIVAYIYLVNKIKKNKQHLNTNNPLTRDERNIKDKDILRKLLMYALPFIIIDLVKSTTSAVDTFTIVKTLTNLGYSMPNVETIFSVINNWGTKINMIVISIAMGVSISLIPNLAGSFVKKEMKDVEKKLNQAYQVLIYLTFPMVIGLFFLAGPVWVSFYGYNQLSILVFKLLVFEAISFSFFAMSVDSMQSLNKTKIAFLALAVTFFGKLLLNIPMMNIVHVIGIPAYYGPSITNLLVHFTSIGIIIYYYIKHFHFNLNRIIKTFIKTILAVIIMYLVMKILNVFYIIDLNSRLSSVMGVIIYSVVGAVTYFLTTYFAGTMEEVFGKTLVNSILVKLHLKKA